MNFKITNQMFFLIITASLISCAYKGQNSHDTQKEIEDRQKIQETFSPIEGVYKGSLRTSGGDQDIQINLFTLEIKDGTNADGTDRIRIIPKAHLKRLSPAGEGTTFNVRFIPDTGDLILTNQNPSVAIDEIHTIQAKIRNSQIQGFAKRPSGLTELIYLTYFGKNETSSEQNEQESVNERIRTEYKEIIGVYRGTVIPPPEEAQPIVIVVDIYINELSNPDGTTTPQLMAHFKRLDDSGGILDLTMNITYRSNLKPKKINFSGKGNGNYFTQLDGYFTEKNMIHVKMSTHRGLIGEGNLKKQ